MKPAFAMPAAVLTPGISWMTHEQTKTQRRADTFADSECFHCHRIPDAHGKKGPDLSSMDEPSLKARMRRQILSEGAEMTGFADALTHRGLNDWVACLHSRRATRVR